MSIGKKSLNFKFHKKNLGLISAFKGFVPTPNLTWCFSTNQVKSNPKTESRLSKMSKTIVKTLIAARKPNAKHMFWPTRTDSLVMLTSQQCSDDVFANKLGKLNVLNSSRWPLAQPFCQSGELRCWSLPTTTFLKGGWGRDVEIFNKKQRSDWLTCQFV